MGSKKRSAWQKQKAEFAASLGGLDGLFADEDAGCTARDPFAQESPGPARRGPRSRAPPQGLRAEEPLRQPLGSRRHGP